MRTRGQNLIEFKKAFLKETSNNSPKLVIKKILITGNVSLIICTILIVLWQLYFSGIFSVKINNLNESVYYKQIIEEVDDFIVLYELDVIDYNNIDLEFFLNSKNDELINQESKTALTCSSLTSSYSVPLMIYSELSNICIEKKRISNKTEITFDSFCTEVLALNETYVINSYKRQRYCYRSFSKRNFKYRFTEKEKGCNEDELLCGINQSYKICLKITSKVIHCPITELAFYFDKDDEVLEANNKYELNIKHLYQDKNKYTNKYEIKVHNPYSNSTGENEVEIENSPKTGLNAKLTDSPLPFTRIVAYNYTNETSQQLTVNLILNPTTYSIFELMELTPLTTTPNDSESTEPDPNAVTLKTHYESYVSYLSTNVPRTDALSMNTFTETYYTKIESGTEIETTSGEYLAYTFKEQMNEEFRNSYIFKNIDPALFAKFGKKIVWFPTVDCIKKVYMNSQFENDYLHSLSYIHMEFLGILYPFLVVWTVAQLIVNLIFTFMYKIRVLMKTINGILSDTDKHYELVTTLTVKSFYYFCLLMRILVMFQIKSEFNARKQFLTDVVDNNCFIISQTNKPSLLMVKLLALKEDPSMEEIVTIVNMIFNVIYVELFLEAGSIGFAFIDKYLNRLLGIY